MDLFSDDYLSHHGILGQKWGVRRYQNKDRTLTELGKIHDREANAAKREGRSTTSSSQSPGSSGAKSTSSSSTGKSSAPSTRTSAIGSKLKTLATKENAKRVAIGAAVVAGTALAIYGATHYPELASTAKSFVTSGASAAQKTLSTVSNTAKSVSGAAKDAAVKGATATQKALSTTSKVAKDTSKALSDISDLTGAVKDELEPKEEKSLREQAIDEVSGKVTEKISEKSKIAGYAANTALNALSGSGKKDGTDGLTLDAQEGFDSKQMEKLLSNVEKIGSAASIGSRVLDTVGSGTEDLANDLLKKLGTSRLK